MIRDIWKMAFTIGKCSWKTSVFCLLATIMISSQNVLASPLFEGDIMGVDSKLMEMTGDIDKMAHNGVKDENLRWTNHRVPYALSDIYSDNDRKLILTAIVGFNKTCIRFVPKSDEDEHYLYIGPGSPGSCSSFVGKQQGTSQLVLLAIGYCLSSPGIIQHELMHALGFWHEQSREDRDLYVDVNFDNIPPEEESQFRKHTKVDSTAFDQPYDFGSVMHYGMYDFAVNDKIYTIRPKPKFAKNEIGQRKWLSPIDIKKINLMYKCEDTIAGANLKSPTTSELSSSSETCQNSCGRYYVAVAPSCQCLRFQLLCDGNSDLPDGSDEQRSTCDFHCKSLQAAQADSDIQPYFQREDTGTCLRKAWLCDGDSAPKYAKIQDRKKCEYYCKGGGYFPTSSTGQCIHWRDLCDGLVDTTDGWDEVPANCRSQCSIMSDITGIPLVFAQIKGRQRCARGS